MKAHLWGAPGNLPTEFASFFTNGEALVVLLLLRQALAGRRQRLPASGRDASAWDQGLDTGSAACKTTGDGGVCCLGASLGSSSKRHIREPLGVDRVHRELLWGAGWRYRVSVNRAQGSFVFTVARQCTDVYREGAALQYGSNVKEQQWGGEGSPPRVSW